MDWVRQYILTVVCVSILCGLIQLSFPGKKSASAAIKLITGLVLTVTVISPLMHMDTLHPNFFINTISADGQWAITDGEKVAGKELAACIKDETESYILDKAKEWGLQIRADVTVVDGMLPSPDSVVITGDVSPYGKKQLSQCLTDDLGIVEENQKWIS